MFLISEFYLFLFIKMLGKMDWRRIDPGLNDKSIVLLQINLFNKVSKN